MNYKFFKDGTTMIPKCSTQLQEVINHFKLTEEDYFLKEDKKKNKFNKPLKISKSIFDLNNTVYDKYKDEFSPKKDKDTRPKKFQKKYLEQTEDKEGYQKALKDWINFCKDFLENYPSTYDANYDYKDTFTKAYESLDQFYKQLSGCIYTNFILNH